MTANEIKLTNGVTISVHSNSFRLIRGRTLLAFVFDEIAYWRDDTSANPDIETYRAVRPSLAHTGGMLIGISSPYRRAGLLHQKFKDHYAVDDNDVLVVRRNGAVQSDHIRCHHRQGDAQRPEIARSEWGAEFRTDVGSLLDDAVIEDAIDYARPLELPPRGGRRYLAFADASAGRHDAFTLCIGHPEGKGRGDLRRDVIRGRRAVRPSHRPGIRRAARDMVAPRSSVTISPVSGLPRPSVMLASGTRPHPSTSRRCISKLAPLQSRRGRHPQPRRFLRELTRLERRVHRSGKELSIIRAMAAMTTPTPCGALYIAMHAARKTEDAVGHHRPAFGFKTWRRTTRTCGRITRASAW